ncbi:MAG: Asp-tRNA(Asn)/Glu-tRNA(Gln) amidotransferase subunit GatC [Campylobacterales bacterium]|nr:Asp-tRNA(Asn)/Glu-tRNA(Gln) amidotransferase subunit GatC [Campylobacterales bacterium]
MTIDDKLLTRLENLSHLRIGDEKKKEVEQNLSDILGFVENLNELDTETISEKFSMEDKPMRLREDVAEADKGIIEEVLKDSPKTTETFFVVPKIIE